MIRRRRILAATGGLAALATARPVAAAETPSKAVPTKRRIGTIQITRGGSQPSRKGQSGQAGRETLRRR
jgi:hypothetical protein